MDSATVLSSADITFDRPSETYNPQKTTINLFLYDIREHTELRNNEPFIERLNGSVTLRRPPLRVACSYLVTAWPAPELAGEAAILKQHELLGEVLRLFAGMATLPHSNGPNDPLASQPYPIPLVTLQSELMRNPAEFWSALGGKLRPSFTLTATIALEPLADVITAPEVSTKTFTLDQASGMPDEVNIIGIPAEPVHAIGGTVRQQAAAPSDRNPLAEVELTIAALGLRVLTDKDGRYTFSGLAAGPYTVSAKKSGYTGQDKQIQVPGNGPTAFDIELS